MHTQHTRLAHEIDQHRLPGLRLGDPDRQRRIITECRQHLHLGPGHVGGRQPLGQEDVDKAALEVQENQPAHQ